MTQNSVITRHSRGRIEAAPTSAGNTPRGLTRHLDHSERGLAMEATRTCTAEACESPYYARNLCQRHYVRQQRAGAFANSLRRKPAEDRFLAKVDKRDDGCWIWTANQITYGYGRFKVDGRMVLAHRWAYERYVGPVPDGLELDHLCRQPSCVNPAHLEPVTHVENVRRMRLAVTHCPQGHEYDTANTYINPTGARACRACRRDRRPNRSK